MNRSRNEYEAQLHGRVSDKGLWGKGEPLDFNNLENAPPLFKFSINEFDKVASCPPPLNKLNSDFFSLRTIASDSYSAKHALQGLLDGEAEDGVSGWAYMYTYLPELAYGLTSSAFGDEEITSVNCRIKAGISAVNPFSRIDGQIGTSNPHTGILLGLFWTPSIKRSDTLLRQRLEGFRPIQAAGEEWYLGRPEELLVEILMALEPSRAIRKPIKKTTIA